MAEVLFRQNLHNVKRICNSNVGFSMKTIIESYKFKNSPAKLDKKAQIEKLNHAVSKGSGMWGGDLTKNVPSILGPEL